jgi:hypothetical protein
MCCRIDGATRLSIVPGVQVQFGTAIRTMSTDEHIKILLRRRWLRKYLARRVASEKSTSGWAKPRFPPELRRSIVALYTDQQRSKAFLAQGQLHGRRLQVAGHPGRGMSFQFTLPAAVSLHS